MSCITELVEIHKFEVSGNLGHRMLEFTARNQVLPGHRHNFGHTMLVGQGALLLKTTTPDGKTVERVVAAPGCAYIDARVLHEVVSLSDTAIAWCVFSARDPMGVVAEEMTPEIARDRFWNFREGQGEYVPPSGGNGF